MSAHYDRPMLNRRQLALLALAQPLASPLAAWSQSNGPDASLETALEQVDGAEAVAWVDARTQEARALIEGLPDYGRRYRDTLASLSARNTNIQFVRTHRDRLYNYYNNADQPHGVWRRTTLEEYRKERPNWQVLVDFDKLASQEMRPLAFNGYQLSPDGQRALIRLSAGGEDRVELREFDLASRQFVAGGFNAPLAKMNADWFGNDELLIATDFGDGSLTRSGYAMTVRRWRRGSALADAPEVLRGEPGDLGVTIDALTVDGSPPVALVGRRVGFFQNRRWLLRTDTPTPTPLALPDGAESWLARGWIVLLLREPFDDGGTRHGAGSVIATPLATAGQPTARFHSLLAAGPRQRAIRTERVRDGFAIAWADNLQPRLAFQRWDGERFTQSEVALPDAGLVSIRADDAAANNQVWLTTQAPLVPQAFGLLDVAQQQQSQQQQQQQPPSQAWAPIKQQLPAFDAAGLSVQRFEARSADGTAIPYTVIAPTAMPLDGSTPTLLYGYGGFGIPLDLSYQRLPGIDWLRYGGAYVLAHIRGGGEFGTEWHEAAKGRQRQKSFDDFIAVAEDIAARRIARASKLGIYGASNGGALVSAVMVQRPELFGAVVSRVPLTDMLEFTRFTAGPSWIGEYGDPAVAADRAVLEKWSPLQNLRDVRDARAGVAYPPVLFIGNRNDDRVHPSHARKMVARLRALGHPQAWLYEERSGGHLGRATPQLLAGREAMLHTFLMGMLQRGGTNGSASG